jgi:hypothetical protein
MTIKRTREIFGDDFADLSDQEVLVFIGDMGSVCDELLKMALSELTPKKNIEHTN